MVASNDFFFTPKLSFFNKDPGTWTNQEFHGSSASASSGSTRGFQEMSQQRLDPDVSLAQNNHNYPHVKLTVRPLKYLKICHRKQERMDRLPNIHVQVRLLFSFREGNYFRNGNFGTAMRPEKKVENERWYPAWNITNWYHKNGHTWSRKYIFRPIMLGMLGIHVSLQGSIQIPHPWKQNAANFFYGSSQF